jgi:integrase
VLGRSRAELRVPARRKVTRRAIVYSKEQIAALFAAAHNPKHRALLMCIYGAGLRVSEAVTLRPTHIESKRGLIRVEQGKGRKDRYTILPNRLIDELRHYYRCFHPGEWLFFGRVHENPRLRLFGQHQQKSIPQSHPQIYRHGTARRNRCERTAGNRRRKDQTPNRTRHRLLPEVWRKTRPQPATTARTPALIMKTNRTHPGLEKRRARAPSGPPVPGYGKNRLLTRSNARHAPSRQQHHGLQLPNLGKKPLKNHSLGVQDSIQCP